jgi:hypothetical protein
MATSSIDARVAPTFAQQHGLITRSQAVTAGMSPRQVQWRLETGRWLVVETSTYRLAGVPFTWETRVLAPVLATGGLASHRSAAVIWGIGGIRAGAPEITVGRPNRYRRTDVRVHESGDLASAGRRVRDGIPVTGVARTLVDLGASVPWSVVEDAALDALDRRLVSWPTILRTYAVHSRQGRTGCGAIRQVIDKNLHKAIPGSRLELRLERLVVRGGLPTPERQVDITDRLGFIGRGDFAYRKQQVVIEVDGRSVHARRLAFEADAIRRSRMSAAGWAVIHVTWEQLLGDPAGVLDRIAAALTRAVAA